MQPCFLLYSSGIFSSPKLNGLFLYEGNAALLRGNLTLVSSTISRNLEPRFSACWRGRCERGWNIVDLPFNSAMAGLNCFIVFFFNLLFYCSSLRFGDQYLKLQGVKVDDLWYNELALAVMTVIIMGFAYIALRLIKKEK